MALTERIGQPSALAASDPGGTSDPAWRDQLGLLAAAIRDYLRRDLGRLVLYSVIAFLLGYAANALLMSLRYQGYARVPPGAPAVGQGNVAYASLVWALASSLVFGGLGYRRAVGGKQFWRDVRGFPRTLFQQVRADGDRAIAHLLWGFAGAMLVVQLLSRTLSVLLAAVLVVGLARIFRPIITGLAMAAYRGIAKRVAPGAPMPPPVAIAVGIMGSIGAMAVGLFLLDQVLKLALALIAVALAVALSVLRRRRMPTVVALALLGAALGVLAALRSHLALAHDGGFQECVTYRLACGATGLLGQSLFGGTAAAVGGGIGGGLGDAAGRIRHHGPQDGDWERWRRAHPLPDGSLPGVGSESWRTFMAERREGHRQEAEKVIGERFDTPLKRIQESLKHIDDQLDTTTKHIHEAQVAVSVLNETASLDVDGWKRLGQTIWDDLASGEAAKRAGLTALKLPKATVEGTYEAGKLAVQLPGMFGVALGWYWNNSAEPGRLVDAYQQFGKAAMDDFMAKVDALGSGDRDKQSQIIADVAGSVAGQEILGFGMGKVMDLVKGPPRDVQNAVDHYWKELGDSATPGKGPGNFDSGIPPRTRAEIIETARAQVAEGGTAVVKLTPEEVELFNVDKGVAMNLYETNLRYNLADQMKIGDAEGPKVRQAMGEDAYPKPNAEKFKGLTPYESQKYKFTTLDGQPLNDAGVTYHFDPPEKPGLAEPDFEKQKFRADNFQDLEKLRADLEAKGGTRIDSMGREQPYKPKFEEVVGTDPATGKPFKAWRLKDEQGRLSITDMDSYHRKELPDSPYAAGNAGETAAPERRFPIPDETRQRWLYQQSDGVIAGPGDTPNWTIDPADPKYQGPGGAAKLRTDISAKIDTMAKAEREGVIEITPDGFALRMGNL